MISSDKIKRRRLSAKERNEFYKMYGGQMSIEDFLSVSLA